MIKSIKVYSLDEAEKIASGYNIKQNVWITILDPEFENDAKKLKKLFNAKGLFFLDLYFRDYSDCETKDIDNNGPKKHHIEQVISFFKLMKNDVNERHIGVNCFAGVSRSAAIALIGWMVNGYNPEIALEKVLSVRKFCYPNNRILRLYDEITGSDSVNQLKHFYDSKQIVV